MVFPAFLKDQGITVDVGLFREPTSQPFFHTSPQWSHQSTMDGHDGLLRVTAQVQLGLEDNGMGLPLDP